MLKGYEVGGADYVTKPFSVTVLCKSSGGFANLELRTPRHDLFDDGFLKIDFSEQSASLCRRVPWTLHRRNTAPCSCS